MRFWRRELGLKAQEVQRSSRYSLQKETMMFKYNCSTCWWRSPTKRWWRFILKVVKCRLSIANCYSGSSQDQECFWFCRCRTYDGGSSDRFGWRRKLWVIGVNWLTQRRRRSPSERLLMLWSLRSSPTHFYSNFFFCCSVKASQAVIGSHSVHLCGNLLEE